MEKTEIQKMAHLARMAKELGAYCYELNLEVKDVLPLLSALAEKERVAPLVKQAKDMAATLSKVAES